MPVPAPAKSRHPAGTPAPTGWLKRLRYDPAHRHVTIREAAIHARVIGGHRAKLAPFRITKAAWRNKDRTWLTIGGVVFLVGGFWWALGSIPLVVLGFIYYQPRCRKTRVLRTEQHKIGRAVIAAPKAVAVNDCHAPTYPHNPRSDKVRIFGATIHSEPLALLLDRVKPLVHQPELVARYITLQVPPGLEPDVLDDMKDVIGTYYKKHLDFTRSHSDPGRVVMREPYVDFLARIAPWEKAAHQTPYRILIGYDRDARAHYDKIADQAILVAGLRGAGKSAWLRAMAGHLFDMPHVELWLGDHLGDLKDFRSPKCSARYARSIPETLELLDDYVASHLAAYATLDRLDIKLLRWPEHTCKVLMLDELGALTLHPDDAIRKHVIDQLYIIATQGRKTMHALIAATQHPDAGTIPTRIRSQFTLSLGLRCGDMHEAAMIFGNDAPKLTAIPANHPGRGFWGADSRTAIELRTPGLFDDDLSWLVGDKGPRGAKHPKHKHVDVEEFLSDDDDDAPPALRLVPDLEPDREATMLRALALAPERGFTVKQLADITDIPKSSLYRLLPKHPLVEMVRHQRPEAFRLKKAA